MIKIHRYIINIAQIGSNRQMGCYIPTCYVCSIWQTLIDELIDWLEVLTTISTHNGLILSTEDPTFNTNGHLYEDVYVKPFSFFFTSSNSPFFFLILAVPSLRSLPFPPLILYSSSLKSDLNIKHRCANLSWKTETLLRR